MKNSTQLAVMLKPAIQAMGFELVGVESITQQIGPTLRVYIDKLDGGVNADDCGEVNKQVHSVLSVEGFPIDEWVVEVSSPGINRRLFTLDQVQQFLSEIAEVKLRDKLDGRRNFKGEILNTTDEGEFTLIVDEKEFVIPFDMVEKMNLIRM